jgi:hypothetical protein
VIHIRREDGNAGIVTLEYQLLRLDLRSRGIGIDSIVSLIVFNRHCVKNVVIVNKIEGTVEKD